jgi:hypothetical protein
MDTLNTEKKSKQVVKGSGYATLRVKKETRKRAVGDLKKINEKEFGRKVRMDEYLSFAINLVTQEHRESLQSSSLTHQDRLSRDYKTYIAQNGMISKDDYLGKRLTGEIPSPKLPRNEAPQKA